MSGEGNNDENEIEEHPPPPLLGFLKNIVELNSFFSVPFNIELIMVMKRTLMWVWFVRAGQLSHSTCILRWWCILNFLLKNLLSFSSSVIMCTFHLGRILKNIMLNGAYYIRPAYFNINTSAWHDRLNLYQSASSNNQAICMGNGEAIVISL